MRASVQDFKKCLFTLTGQGEGRKKFECFKHENKTILNNMKGYFYFAFVCRVNEGHTNEITTEK